MKCLICKEELTGNVCTRCGFPKISVVGGAEDDPVIRKQFTITEKIFSKK